jgi:hypothetical protein
MLWAILLFFLVLWMLGLVSGYAMDNIAHIPLFIAIVALLFQIEDECSNYGSGFTKKRYFKRQFIHRSERILPRPTPLSGEKDSKFINSRPPYREG